MNTQEIVAKLWSMCDVLRDDGITYQDYVTELTYLLFLKMMQETDKESALPVGYRWSDLVAKEGVEQLKYYRQLLVHLGTDGKGRVQAIFNNANSSLKKPRNLLKLVTDIDALDWYSARSEGLGDLYEGLLEKNANEKKSGAGQYFTPRPLIESIINVTKPQAGEVIQDPAAGTGGFLTHADRYIKEHTSDLFDLDTAEQKFQTNKAYHAVELVDDTHRLLLMNVMLHGMDGTFESGDTMGDVGKGMAKAHVVLTNPPFGTKKGGGITRDDFTYPTSNKQLCFLQHIYRGLHAGGRAAVVLPDNVLFEEGVGTKIRTDLLDKCNLHTVLRLPTGIFYAAGVKTNVLFFTRGKSDTGNTKAVWFYDMRTNMQQFGKRAPLTLAHFEEFEKCYGKKADGTSKRKEETGDGAGEESRFRCFTREDIAKRVDNLDISWLKDDDAQSGEDLAEPDVIAAMIRERLGAALEEMDALGELLEGKA
ncbi:SAM-dependent methyltransferase [Chromatiales bacterium (ex Bugula neritina AB1)]|nr:SAM-dependent methyltransferase [Chromatiales bacterium (ex Bugula neritina AB1)]